MQDIAYAKEYTERAMEYIEAVARMESRFQSRALYRWRLQAMVLGDSPNPLKNGRQRDGFASPKFESKGEREPSSASAVSSPSVSLQARLDELDRELMKEMIHIQRIREQTWELFSRLSHPKAGKMLEEFYLNDTPIHVIAAQTAYNERYVYRIKNQALQELGKLLMDSGIEDPIYVRERGRVG